MRLRQSWLSHPRAVVPAAVAGALATAASADAAEITRDLIPDISVTALTSPTFLDIDLNGSLDLAFNQGYGGQGAFAQVTGVDPLDVVWLNNSAPFAQAFSFAQRFGQTSSSVGSAAVFIENSNAGNPWLALGGADGFLGGLFEISGVQHAFWVRLSVNTIPGATLGELSLKEVGWDNAVASPVAEPATLSLLALGAAGVAALRRRRQ